MVAIHRSKVSASCRKSQPPPKLGALIAASQVAAVWRRVCGVTSGPSPAAVRTDRKALLIFLTGSPFHSTMSPVATAVLPAAKMGQKTRGQPYRRLTFFRFSCARCAPIKHATVKVDPTSSHRWAESRPADRPGARAGIERNQNEPSNMLSCGPRGNFTMLTLSKTPCCPKKPSSFGPRQPTHSCRRPRPGSATGICADAHPFSQ